MICHTVLLIHCDAFPRTFVFLRCSVFIFTTRRSVCSALLIVCGHICRHIQYCCRRICRESLDADSCSIESPAAAAADVGCSASVLCIRELGPSVVVIAAHATNRPSAKPDRLTDRWLTDRWLADLSGALDAFYWSSCRMHSIAHKHVRVLRIMAAYQCAYMHISRCIHKCIGPISRICDFLTPAIWRRWVEINDLDHYFVHCSFQC